MTIIFLLTWALDVLVAVLLFSCTIQLSECWIANKHHPSSSSFLKVFDARNGSWSVGNSPELPMWLKDRVIQILLGWSAWKFCAGELCKVWVKDFGIAVTPRLSPLHRLNVIPYKGSNTSSCHCLSRVKPDPAPLTDPSAACSGAKPWHVLSPDLTESRCLPNSASLWAPAPASLTAHSQLSAPLNTGITHTGTTLHAMVRLPFLPASTKTQKMFKPSRKSHQNLSEAWPTWQRGHCK